jgi:hypothetical protein
MLAITWNVWLFFLSHVVLLALEASGLLSSLMTFDLQAGPWPSTAG